MLLNSTIVIFGGTGDLAQKKLIPSLFELVKKGILRKDTLIVGIGRRNYTQTDYKRIMKKHVKGAGTYWDRFNLKYYKTDFTKDACFADLKKFLDFEDKGKAERVFYLATHYSYFENITRALAHCGLNHKKGCDKIAFEKPFGEDYKSSEKLNKNIQQIIPEKGVYRVDHFLGKETIMNLLVLRFANPFLERNWCHLAIDNILVDVPEDIGVGNRLGYYSKTGAVKDMIQNHLLQVTSFLLMNAPKTLGSKDIHAKKEQALKTLRVKEVKLGSYKGLREEFKKAKIPYVPIETYAEVTLLSSMKKWKGVPIKLRTGKKLKEKYGRITLNFKKEPCILYCNPKTEPNKLVINIQPTQDINMSFVIRNHKGELIEETLTFNSSQAFGPNTIDAYQKLFEDIIKGDKTRFASEGEIQEAWKITDRIKTKKTLIRTY